MSAVQQCMRTCGRQRKGRPRTLGFTPVHLPPTASLVLTRDTQVHVSNISLSESSAIISTCPQHHYSSSGKQAYRMSSRFGPWSIPAPFGVSAAILKLLLPCIRVLVPPKGAIATHGLVESSPVGTRLNLAGPWRWGRNAGLTAFGTNKVFAPHATVAAAESDIVVVTKRTR